MNWLPCRVCGSPVTGASGVNIKSYCCSKSDCIKKDTGVDTDTPTVILSDQKWKSKITYLTRGY